MTTRVIGADTFTLLYDGSLRMVGVQKNGATIAEFAYDGDGRMVVSSMGGVTTYTVGGYFEWRVDASGSRAVKYYSAGGTRVAMRQGDTVTYLFGDHLGSTSVAFNDAANATQSQGYTAFGSERYSLGGELPTDYAYTGQKEFAEIGLHFYNARWYDGALGRFTQADTIIPQPGNPMAWDRFAYTLNNPVKYTDPTGHDTCNEEGKCWDRNGKTYQIHKRGRRSMSWHRLTKLQLASYSQSQLPNSPTGCGPYSLAIAMNLLFGEQVFDGYTIEEFFERMGYKYPNIGIPSPNFENAAESLLFDETILTFSTNMTVEDLLNSLEQGNFSIVAVSWQGNLQIIETAFENLLGIDINSNGVIEAPTVGHYMVFVSYDADNDLLGFLDPGQMDKNLRWLTRGEFEKIWLKQPNIAIPSGSTIKVKDK